MQRNSTEPSLVPEVVSSPEPQVALAPLMDLLGTDISRVFNEGGIIIRDGFVTLTIAGPVVTSAASRNVVMGQDDLTEAATEVRVKVRA